MTDISSKNHSRCTVGEPVKHAGATTPFDNVESNATFQPFRLETIAHDGAYAVSFRIEIPENARRSDLRGVVDIEVESGAIGIGFLSGDYSSFVGAETMISTGPRRRVYVSMDTPDAAMHLMLRNASHDGATVARVYGVAMRDVNPEEERREAIQACLWDAPVIPFDHFVRTGGEAAVARSLLATLSRRAALNLRSATFPLAVTHTSRTWDWQRCTRDFLRDRFQGSGRLDNLPAFETLSPSAQARSYSGRLTLFDLTFDSDGISLTATRCIDTEHKSSHACKVGDTLVVNLDDYVILTPANRAVPQGNSPPSIVQIEDPWFAGLQMAFAIDENHCVISASGPDALMVLNLPERRVVRRWRVPSDRYGRNYDLTETSSVRDHFIANDMQLAHLNCAFPDGHSGFWISTLAQGDIGHVASDGTYELIASDFVGCHGIRYSRELAILYFSDSCSGQLIGIGTDRVPRVLGAVDSRWLHDALHLVGNVFMLCLCDKNAIVLLDISSNTELARFDMQARGANVQFINVTGEPTYRYE